jgi:glycosyltransferase involved in cell wall biosynthesis
VNHILDISGGPTAGLEPARVNRIASLPDARELVSVIVPAYNAAAFLNETLRSIRAQTYRALEIIVVDDGSTDSTAAIVQRHAAEDSRVRLVQQLNQGVGAARNAGIRRANGRYIAPVDADDLWRPRKIERQMAALAAAPGDVGLVYTWFAIIDERGRVTNTRSRPRAEGDVLERMCLGNLAGNASSALMPKDVVLAMGGYDENLHSQDAQGCEDLKLYWRIAEVHDFVCVPEHLTGYRIGRDNMSNDFQRMLRSFDIVMSACRERRPELARQFHRGRVETLRWLAIRALRAKAPVIAWRLLREMWRYDCGAFLVSLVRLPIHFSRVTAETQVKALKARLYGPPEDFLPGAAAGNDDRLSGPEALEPRPR